MLLLSNVVASHKQQPMLHGNGNERENVGATASSVSLLIIDVYLLLSMLRQPGGYL